MPEKLRVGVVGYGYWGPNLARNLTASPLTQVACIADLNEQRRAAAGSLYPVTPIVADASELIAREDVDAVAIATPLFTHHPLAMAALEAGKHVLVEKPLAASVAECLQLQEAARAGNLTIMVDHTFIYTGAVQKIREVIRSGELGQVLYFDSVRINLGLFQSDFNVLWDLAPHDLSIFDHCVGGEPRWVSAVASQHYEGQHANLAYLTIGYDNDLLAHVHVNWAAPVKTRRITIAGTKQMLVYDDTQPAERVKLYESAVDVQSMDAETTYRWNVQYRTGAVLAPKLSPTEALRGVVEEFACAIAEKRASLTDIDAGIRVVRILEAAQRSVDQESKRIEL